jgi:hypothetical protein
MGFNKRYITKDKILNAIKEDTVHKLFMADALIMDSWSSVFQDNYDFGASYRMDRVKLENDTKYSSFHDSMINHEIFPKVIKLSNSLEGLLSTDSWLDILVVLELLGSEGTDDIRGNFKALKKHCIDKIMNHFTMLSRNKSIDKVV